MAEPRIVAGVGIAAHADDPAVGADVERAMHQAVTDALAEGISLEDSDTIRARIQAAIDAKRLEHGLSD